MVVIAAVSLLQHENNDIMVDTINLLHELTQSNEGAADEAEDEESDAYLLHEAFIVRMIPPPPVDALPCVDETLTRTRTRAHRTQ